MSAGALCTSIDGNTFPVTISLQFHDCRLPLLVTRQQEQTALAISTFSPVGSLSSGGLRMCVGVPVHSTGTVRNELIFVGMPT